MATTETATEEAADKGKPDIAEAADTSPPSAYFVRDRDDMPFGLFATAAVGVGLMVIRHLRHRVRGYWR